MARQEDPRDDGMNEEVVWPPKPQPGAQPTSGGVTPDPEGAADTPPQPPQKPGVTPDPLEP